MLNTTHCSTNCICFEIACNIDSVSVSEINITIYLSIPLKGRCLLCDYINNFILLTYQNLDLELYLDLFMGSSVQMRFIWVHKILE